MAKKKPVYYVWLYNSRVASYGMQPVKANNKIEARKKFKKRFPKLRIMDIALGSGNHISNPI